MTWRPVPQLHLIGPLGVVKPARFIEVADAAARGGCDAVHLRLRGAETADLLSLLQQLWERVRATGAAVLVNERPDIALMANCEGVQLPEGGFPVPEARKIVGDGMLIGRSIHDIAGARDAEAQGADFLLAGHVFDTDSKRGTPGRGLPWLREITGATSLPVIAIGGISVERIPAVLDAGAHGVALGRELLLAADPEATAREALARIDEHESEGNPNDAAD